MTFLQAFIQVATIFLPFLIQHFEQAPTGTAPTITPAIAAELQQLFAAIAASLQVSAPTVPTPVTVAPPTPVAPAAPVSPAAAAITSATAAIMAARAGTSPKPVAAPVAASAGSQVKTPTVKRV
jgi:hypothetical protein